MPVIENYNDIKKALQPYIIKAMELTRNDISEVISKKVFDYYNEEFLQNQSEYISDLRQKNRRPSDILAVSKIISENGTYSFRIGWDQDYLEFQYPGVLRTRGTGGLQESDWPPLGRNSKTDAGSHKYWKEAIEELGGKQGIINRFKRNCKLAGLPVT